jgi:hypothetical protein
MTENQLNHKQLRASYLESLAEAIVLHHSPYLSDPEYAQIKRDQMLQQLRQLHQREYRRSMYRILGHTLSSNSNPGLRRVNVPDDMARGQNLGNAQDPKTWKGPWLSITNTEEIAQRVKTNNIQQCNQAENTPFVSGPLATLIGRNGDSPSSQALLNGLLPTNLLPDLLPETVRVLQTLATPVATLADDSPVTITEEEFVKAYRVAKESTSSSSSGRHIGHYKAVLKAPDLIQVHNVMMSLPYQVGFAPHRWTNVMDIMLEKEPGNSRCHRLPILALFENDFNQSKHILVAQKVGHHVEDNDMVSNMQHVSRPGKNCHSAVLQKVLSHDIVRLTHTTSAFIENDATGCYDCLMNNLILLLLLKLGLQNTATKCLGTTWDQTVHRIKTIYGTSDTTYFSTPTTPLFGPGQGSTAGPLLWLLVFCLIVDSIDPRLATV